MSTNQATGFRRRPKFVTVLVFWGAEVDAVVNVKRAPHPPPPSRAASHRVLVVEESDKKAVFSAVSRRRRCVSSRSPASINSFICSGRAAAHLLSDPTPRSKEAASCSDFVRFERVVAAGDCSF